MKSGLEDRNNYESDQLYRYADHCVSMKSGLEDRNNSLRYCLSVMLSFQSQ